MGLLKVSNFLSRVTCEPVIFFTLFAHEVFYITNQNMYLQKSCRNDTTSSAPDLRTPCDNESAGEEFVLTFYNKATLLGFYVSLVFSIYATNYSDKAGRKRKIFIILTVTTLILRTGWAILQAFFWHWSPRLGVVVNVVLGEAGGDLAGLNIFTRAFIFDTTSSENRLNTIVVLNALQMVGTYLGKAIAGRLLSNCGFIITFLVCLALQWAALISTIVFVREKAAAVPNKQRVNCRELFNFKEIYQMLKLILFPKKPIKIFASIWILVLINSTIIFTAGGESSVLYMYLRKRFGWNEVLWSDFDSFRVLFPMIGSCLCSLVLIRWLKFHDCVIGIFATFCDTLAVIGYYFVMESWQMFLIPVFDMFQGVASMIATTLISQFFSENEFGRMNSVMCILTTITASGAIFIYSALSNGTTDTFPNSFFLLSIFLNALSCVLYGITLLILRKPKDVKTPPS